MNCVICKKGRTVAGLATVTIERGPVMLVVRRVPADVQYLDVRGIDMHIGSQITELAPFEQAFRLMADLTRNLVALSLPS